MDAFLSHTPDLDRTPIFKKLIQRSSSNELMNRSFQTSEVQVVKLAFLVLQQLDCLRKRLTCLHL